MVESKIRVEALSSRFNPTFYGSVLVKKVTEETLIHDYDKRKNVAPCGINATIKTNDNVVLDIRINRYYLEYEAENRYLAFFSIEEKVYEVCVWFDTNDKVKSIWLSEWLQSGDFENGEDADIIYHKEDFVTLEEFLS